MRPSTKAALAQRGPARSSRAFMPIVFTLMIGLALCLGLATSPAAWAQTRATPPATGQQASSPSGLPGLLQNVLTTIGVVGNKQQNSSTAAPGAGPQPSASASTVPLHKTRIPPAYQALFAKREVTGEDLYQELRDIRLQLQRERSATALAHFSLALNRAAAAPTDNTSGVVDILGDTAVKYLIETMRSGLTSYAFDTLDGHLEYLLDKRKDAMAAEKVTLPTYEGMNEAQARRTVTMAALVVAARVSKKMLDKADEDFQSIRTDYGVLLAQREEAAKLLFETIDQRRAANRRNDGAALGATDAALRQNLRPEDLAFIDSEFNDMSVADFAKNLAAQNLAIDYLRGKNPEKYKNYRSKADDVVRRTSAYVRTVTGVAAFGAMSASFAQSVASVIKERQLSSMIGEFPLALDFLRAAMPLTQKSVEVSVKGVTFPLQSAGTSVLGVKIPGIFGGKSDPELFTIEQGQNTSKAASSKAVFQAVQTSGKTEPFVKAFFADRAGWLGRVHMCDPTEAGQMLDAAVPKDERTRFVQDYFGWTREQDQEKVREFAFMNALAAPGTSQKERGLGDTLFGKDQRQNATSLPIAAVQKSIEKRHIEWSDRQLLRLIFENREGAARYAKLEVDGLFIRPTPSPESVYAYESRVEACRRMADRELGGGGAPRPPATRPGQRSAKK